jgi:N-acetylmuramoyl-L-alanine amidase
MCRLSMTWRGIHRIKRVAKALCLGNQAVKACLRGLPKTAQLLPPFIFLSLLLVIYPKSEAFAEVENPAKRGKDLSPKISVIYPQEGAQITVSDSTFIFGSVTPKSKLKINGFEAKVHPNGAFLAFLPLKPAKSPAEGGGDFVFELIASNKQGISTKRVEVKLPKPILSVPEDSFCIVKGSFLPKKDMILTAGDILETGFRGTPNCKASFSIQGLVSDIPMTESPPKNQPYWGKEVFGEGLIPEEFLLKGVYTGSYIIKNTDKVDSARIIFKLLKKSNEDIISITDSSQSRITIRQDEIPQIVEFTGSSVIARAGPKLGYLLLYQPPGIRAVATGKIGEWVRLKLAEGEDVWVHQDSIKYLPLGTPIPKSILTSMRTETEDKKTRLRIFLQEKLPFRVEQQSNPSALFLTIYGVTSNTDRIRYDFRDKLIKEIEWAQPEKEIYQLKVYLNLEQQWGYDVFYEGSVLILEIKDQPKLNGQLKGLKIAVDPGHSPDPGAVGPTGLEESVVNLEIAKKLKEVLEKNGAEVILTRSGMDSLALYDRPKIAIQESCDILISIHNNALPDGINPFYNNGTSTYYYHPQAFFLAKAIQKELVERLPLPDYGIYYGNLALTRPTQLLAVLVECAFMMIPEQEELLRTEKFQKECAQAICNGILNFVEKSEKQ